MRRFIRVGAHKHNLDRNLGRDVGKLCAFRGDLPLICRWPYSEGSALGRRSHLHLSSSSGLITSLLVLHALAAPSLTSDRLRPPLSNRAPPPPVFPRCLLSERLCNERRSWGESEGGGRYRKVRWRWVGGWGGGCCHSSPVRRNLPRTVYP